MTDVVRLTNSLRKKGWGCGWCRNVEIFGAEGAIRKVCREECGKWLKERRWGEVLES